MINKKISIFFVLGLLFLVVGIIAIDFPGSTLYERYQVNDDTQKGWFVANRLYGESFTIGTTGTNEDFELDGVGVKYYWAGTEQPCNMQAYIYQVTGDVPTGAILSSGSADVSGAASSPGIWINISMGAITLNASTKYALVFGVDCWDGSNYPQIRADESSPSYAGGAYFQSLDNSSFTAYSSLDTLFEIYGTAGDLNPPTFDEIPINQTIVYDHAFYYEINASDNVGISAYIVDDTQNFSIDNVTGVMKNNTHLPLGIYPLNITINDTSNNLNTTVFQVEVVNDTFPSVNISFPNNITYLTNVTNMSMIISDSNGLDTCWYSLDSGNTNTTIPCGNNVSGISGVEGSNQFVISANNTFGIINTTSVTFIQNVLPPVVSNRFPANGNHSNLTTIELGGTMGILANDTLIQNFTIFIYNTTDGTLYHSETDTPNGILDPGPGVQGNYLIEVTLDEGNYTWYYQSSDIEGRMGTSPENWTLIIDTTLPVITFTTPTEGTYPIQSTPSYTFAATAEDPYLDAVNVTVYDSTGAVTYTNFTSGILDTIITLGETITLSEGNNTIEISARDSGASSPKIKDKYLDKFVKIHKEKFEFELLNGKKITRDFEIYDSTDKKLKASDYNLISTDTWIDNDEHLKTVWDMDSISDDYYFVISMKYQQRGDIELLTDRGRTRIVDRDRTLYWSYEDLEKAGFDLVYDWDDGNKKIDITVSKGDYIPSGLHWSLDPIVGGLNHFSKNATVTLDTTAPTTQSGGTGGTTPVSGGYYSNPNINFSVNTTDPSSGISNVTVVIVDNVTGIILNETVIDAGGVSGGFFGAIYTFITDGLYNWYFKVVDLLSNSVTTVSHLLTFDSTPPNTSIVYPYNETFPFNVTELTYTYDELNLNNCWYSNDSGVTNTTIACGTNVTGITTADGDNVFKIYVNDSAGTVTEDSVSFVVNTTGPFYTLFSPANGTQSNVSSNINFTGVLEGWWIQNITFVVDSIIQSAVFNTTYNDTKLTLETTPYTILAINLTEGEHTYFFLGGDFGDNTTSTEVRDIDVQVNGSDINITNPFAQINNISVGENLTIEYNIIEPGRNVTDHIVDCFITSSASSLILNREAAGIINYYGWYNFSNNSYGDSTVNTSDNVDVIFTDGTHEITPHYKVAGSFTGDIPNCYDSSLVYNSSDQLIAHAERHYCLDDGAGNKYLMYIRAIGEALTINYTNAQADLSPVDCAETNASTFIYQGYPSVALTVIDKNGYTSTYSREFLVAYSETNVSFNNDTFETSQERISINFTYNNSLYSSVTGNLVYNGTSYLGTKIGAGENTELYSSVDVPIITSQEENVTFYWDITLNNASDSVKINSSINQQTIKELIFTECNATYPLPVYVNYSVYDESEKTLLGASFDATFKYSLGGNLKENYTYSEVNDTLFRFCTNTNDTFYVSSIISLDSDGYDHRDYTFYNKEYTNDTTEQHLYLLNSSESSNIIVQVVDPGLQPLVGYYIDIDRFYADTNSFTTIISDQTDEFGQIVTKLIENTIKYRFIFKNPSGTIVKTTDKVTVACHTTICVMQFVIEDTTDDFERFQNTTGFESTLYFDDVANIISVNWNDVTGDSATVRLLVERTAINGTTTVCDIPSLLTNSFINCTLGDSKASYSAQFFRTVSGENEKRVNLLNVKVGEVAAKLFGREGLIWVFLLLFTLIGVGSFNPTVGAMLYLVGFIGFGLMGIISFTATIFFANAALVAIFIWAFKS